eukprot:1245671-Rhodomonas_salina.2
MPTAQVCSLPTPCPALTLRSLLPSAYAHAMQCPVLMGRIVATIYEHVHTDGASCATSGDAIDPRLRCHYGAVGLVQTAPILAYAYGRPWY